MKQFAGLQSHHLSDYGMGSSNDLAITTWVTDKILLKFQLWQSLECHRNVKNQLEKLDQKGKFNKQDPPGHPIPEKGPF
jgi:hypothetical protein